MSLHSCFLIAEGQYDDGGWNEGQASPGTESAHPISLDTDENHDLSEDFDLSDPVDADAATSDSDFSYLEPSDSPLNVADTALFQATQRLLFRKAISCLQCPVVLPATSQWILEAIAVQKESLSNKELLQRALNLVSIHQGFSRRSSASVVALMTMSANSSQESDLAPSLRLDTNTYRSRKAMFPNRVPPVATFTQCSNTYCKELESDNSKQKCLRCTGILLNSAKEPIETFSYLPLSASLQLLLFDEEFRNHIENPPMYGENVIDGLILHQ